MATLNLLDFIFDDENEKRKRSLERAIERQQNRTPLDVEYGLLSSAMRSRTPARADYPEISATLGGLRPREVDAAYEMGRQEGMKAAARSSDIPSVMQLTEDEVFRRGLEGVGRAAMNPDSYRKTFLEPAGQAASTLANRASTLANRASPYVDDFVDVARTGLGSIYTGLTDPSVVEPSEDDTVLQRALKSGVGNIQGGLRFAGDLAALPFDAARDVGMYLGSSAEDPFVPQYIKDAAEAYNLRSQSADAIKAVEKSQEEALKRAKEIIDKREAAPESQVKKEDKPDSVSSDNVSVSDANRAAVNAITNAVSASPQSLLETQVNDGLLGQRAPSELGQQLQDLLVAYGRQQAAQPQLVTADDLAKLRPITPATLLAGARDERVAREKRQEKSKLAQRKLDVEESIARLRRAGSVDNLEYNVLIKASNFGYNSLSKTERDIYNAAIKKPEILQIMEMQGSNPSIASGNTANRFTVTVG